MQMPLLLWYTSLPLVTSNSQNSCDSEMNAVNFLQTGVATFVSPQAEACLRFMHIPKTGGTSIDSANLHLPPGQRAFDSYMLRAYERIAEADQIDEKDLGNLFDFSHSSELVYTPFRTLHRRLYHWLPPGATDQCEDVHTPPSRSSAVALYYQEDRCTTFCVVREPLARFWSGFQMFYYACDPDSVNKKALELLSDLLTRPYEHECFFMLQVESIYGVTNKTAASHQYCNRILHQENLDQEFDALMAEFGRNVELPEEDLMSSWTDSCNMTVSDLRPETKAAVYEYFKADYEAFGYPKPDI
mmetsp:Transcript_40089/g.95774  ORF Transcript_40089/g.95774 Transcript_40089/m.95774 type:complete len:301 (+) Transcript_40089:76-978(+)